MTLREILKERNIKQSVVAEALGVKVNHLGRYDDLLKRSLDEVLKISEATGIDIFDLTGIRLGNIANPANIPTNFNTDIPHVQSVPNLSIEETIEEIQYSENIEKLIDVIYNQSSQFSESQKQTDRLISLMESQQRTIEKLSDLRKEAAAGARGAAPKAAQG